MLANSSATDAPKELPAGGGQATPGAAVVEHALWQDISCHVSITDAQHSSSCGARTGSKNCSQPVKPSAAFSVEEAIMS